MLSVPIHKDLTKYQAKIVFGLTMRTLTCIVAAIGTSVFVGAYAWFVLGIPFDSISWAAYAVGLPLWAMAFWTPRPHEGRGVAASLDPSQLRDHTSRL